MVQVATKGFSVKLVDNFSFRLGFESTRNSIHPSRVDAVKMDGMGVSAAIGEANPQAIAFRYPQSWSWNAPVISPSWIENLGGNFN